MAVLPSNILDAGGPMLPRHMVFAAAAAAVACACAHSTPVRTISSPEWAVTGGNALIEVDPTVARLTLNGRDVTDHLRVDERGRRLALLSGLADGRNQLDVLAFGTASQLLLINYPQSGPVFSGPHQFPFVCETHAFKLPDGATLGQSMEPDCWAETNVQFLYKSMVDGRLKPYHSGEAPPDQIATITTRDGIAIDYIVRLETGVINRAIYQIALIASPDEAISPFTPSKGWNGRLVYSFGGGCGAAYRQGRGTGGVIDNLEIGNDALDQGYALASATLNVLGANCNDVTSAETALMVKEHFVETIGPPDFTIGLGGSGGAMQQNLIQANYPGVLDGLLPGRSFPDTLTTLVSAADCPLLHNYFKNAPGWTDGQKAAVVGFPSYAHCSTAWFNYLPRWISPLGSGCDATAFITAQEGGNLAGTNGAAPAHRLYDPKTNPAGVRCGYFDNTVNVWGRNLDGSTRTPLDNVGVQYGLNAFNRGVIDFAQFVDLNRRVGGFDADAGFSSARMTADVSALRTAYQSGRVNQGHRMDLVPIIDVRSYVDENPVPDVHTAQTTEVARERWRTANGQSENFVAWLTATRGSLRDDITDPTSPLRQAMRLALAEIDAWLTAIKRDGSDRPQAVKVIANKPTTLADACFGENGIRLDAGGAAGKACMSDFPTYGDPRMAAGEPLERLHLKCELKPIRASDYQRSLSDNELAQLREIFPDGVCDYTRPPIGLAAGTAWLSYDKVGGSLISRR